MIHRALKVETAQEGSIHCFDSCAKDIDVGSIASEVHNSFTKQGMYTYIHTVLLHTCNTVCHTVLHTYCMTYSTTYIQYVIHTEVIYTEVMHTVCLFSVNEQSSRSRFAFRN